MDLSVLPDIFALSLLIGAYRPLVRRAGAHVNLWFVGWGFVLLQQVCQLFEGPPGVRRAVLHLVGLAALELCGLSFVLASANTYKKEMEAWFAAAMGLPMVLQITITVAERGAIVTASHDEAHYAVNALFLLPLVRVMARRQSQNRMMFPIAAGFAIFGIATLPLAVGQPELITIGALAMVYLSAAYVCLLTAPSYTKGQVTTVVGLALWGIRYPFIAAMKYFHPGFHLDHGLMELPQYMVVAGSILTLLEEHLVRTERMAMHDALTDLPNRRLLEERFEAAMAEAKRNKTTVACLVIDVDNFKQINDTLGHAVGDELLRALAVRLSWHISPRDMLARTGGDEFTAMLAGVSDEHHLRFIASAMMSAASVPIAAEGMSIDVRISMGIALSPDHADDMDGLRESADEAMYRAKRRGGNTLAFAGEPADEADAEFKKAFRRPPSAAILQMKPMSGVKRAGRGSRGA